MKSIKVFLVMILMSFAFSANAYVLSLTEASNIIRGDDSNKKGHLAGYALGVMDLGNGRLFCIPSSGDSSSILAATMILVILDTDRDVSFAFAFAAKLKAQYPC
jgi:hypothetical protein